jgi:outer membrane protein assembly factor BamB
MDRYLYALDAENGTLLWKSEDLGGPIVSPPAISETGLIIISTFDNEVIALDENSHDVEWRFSTSDWAWGSPFIDNDQVYVSDISGVIYALELATGDIIWQIQPGGGIYDAPVVLEDQIYFSTDSSSLVVVSKDGVIQRNQPIEGKLYAGPVSGGDKLLLAPSESEYYLIAMNINGVQTWGYPPAEK